MDNVAILTFLTVLIGLYMAWNIGANDVANAMGTSVGSKALTLTKAVILAAILEFAGAFFLGSHVTDTIQSGIVNADFFQYQPKDYALGMIASLLACSIWLNLATFLRLPVSTTHAIIGSIIGFGLSAGGVKAIIWNKFFLIALSWVLSPIVSACIAYTIFHLLQKYVFYSFFPLKAAKKVAPYFVFLMVITFVYSLLYGNFSIPYCLLIASSTAFLVAIIFRFFLKTITIPKEEITEICVPLEKIVALEKAKKHLERLHLSSCGDTKKEISLIQKKLSALSYKIHSKREVFHTSAHYKKVERIFSFLQIMSACFVAFAHGSNDVANAIGPVSAVFQILHTQTLVFSNTIPSWILLMGSFGIVIGLATWGWRVIETVGKKITELTPSRGFSAEFGSALTILFASQLGLPISTTHALIAAVLGVGLAKGISALNLKTLQDIMLTWVVTLPLCGLLTAGAYHVLKLLF